MAASLDLLEFLRLVLAFLVFVSDSTFAPVVTVAPTTPSCFVEDTIFVLTPDLSFCFLWMAYMYRILFSGCLEIDQYTLHLMIIYRLHVHRENFEIL